MSKIDDIKQAVARLSPEELTAFREWFEELEAQQWDEQIERGINAGKLDWLAETALSEHRAGKSTKIS